MHPDQDARAHALTLPVELYLEIILFLDIDDVFTLKKTCKYLLAVTRERSLWSALFTRLRATQALPCSRAEFMGLSSTQAERVLFAAHKVEVSFQALREHTAHRILTVKQSDSSMNTSMYSWRVLTFISDRFLLSVDDASVVIWNTSTPTLSPTVASPPWVHFTLPNVIGYASCYSTLYIATARVHVDHQSAVIYSVPLPPSGVSESHQACLHPEAEFPLLETELLKDMDPCTGRALLYFPSTSIHVLHWRDDNKRSTINIPPDDLDEGWNGVTSLRFCGPYILCFKVRAVEAYLVPTDPAVANPLPMFRHRFGPVCYRVVSLSQARVSRCPSGEVYTIYMLTNDVYQGMSHYRIRVTTMPVPSMSVKVLAKRGIQVPELVSLQLHPGSGLIPAADYITRRMFVSAWSLGSAGLRGVWVYRLRGSIDRRVVAFTTHPSRLCTKEAPSVQGEGSVSGGDAPDEVPMMDGTVVHVISSYNLRDDVTICAVSEWTGRIALGSRVGAIVLL